MCRDPDLAIAIAIANQDHGLDGYVGGALILILILAIARSMSMNVLMGLAHEHRLRDPAQEAGKRNWRWRVTKPFLVRSANATLPPNPTCTMHYSCSKA